MSFSWENAHGASALTHPAVEAGGGVYEARDSLCCWWALLSGTAKPGALPWLSARRKITSGNTTFLLCSVTIFVIVRSTKVLCIFIQRKEDNNKMFL